jgi:hypothetical protein
MSSALAASSLHPRITAAPLTARAIRRLSIGLAGLMMLLAQPLSAVTIVDTGPGSPTGSLWTLSSSQWLAGEFSVGSAQNITSIEGWIRSVILNSGNYFVALAADNGPGGNVPGTTLFSTTFATSSALLNTAAWQGAFSLNWAIGPGTYWVIFGTVTGGAVGQMPGGAPNPLINEASGGTPSQSGQWGFAPFIDIGVRIEAGAAAAVSDRGATALLLGGALLGLVALRHRPLQTLGVASAI